MRRLPQLLLVAVLCYTPLLASAQPPDGTARNGNTEKSAAVPVPATPERTTASFGEWVLRCENLAARAKRVCEAAHMIVVKGQTAPIAQVAIGRPAPKPNEGERLTIVVPPNITIGVSPQIAIAKAGAAPIELTWQRCLPGACFASVAVSSAVIGKLAAQTEPGRIVFKNAAENKIVLPLSFRGLSQALAALAKEQ